MGATEDHARRLVVHPRWEWKPGIVAVWPGLSARVVVLAVTAQDTLIVGFIGQGLGLEANPKEQGLYPDLTHPATAGLLLSMWLRWSPQAQMSICRWAETDEPNKVEETQPKRWAITMDLGSFDRDAQGHYLGVAIAKVLLQTWRKQERMTPLKLVAVEKEESHD